jgi:hypothetical protein
VTPAFRRTLESSTPARARAHEPRRSPGTQRKKLAASAKSELVPIGGSLALAKPKLVSIGWSLALAKPKLVSIGWSLALAKPKLVSIGWSLALAKPKLVSIRSSEGWS